MPGVMGTRGELVDDQFAVALQEHFDSEESNQIEASGHLTGELASRLSDTVRDARRSKSDIKNVLAVNIFADRKDRRLTVGSARDND